MRLEKIIGTHVQTNSNKFFEFEPFEISGALGEKICVRNAPNLKLNGNPSFKKNVFYLYPTNSGFRIDRTSLDIEVISNRTNSTEHTNFTMFVNTDSTRFFHKFDLWTEVINNTVDKPRVSYRNKGTQIRFNFLRILYDLKI